MADLGWALLQAGFAVHQAQICSSVFTLDMVWAVREQQLFGEDLLVLMAEAQEDKPKYARNFKSLLVLGLLMFH